MPGGPLNVTFVVIGKGGIKVGPFEKTSPYQLASLKVEPAGAFTK